MNRSSRIRKPSQKAREIAEAALLLSSSDPSKSKPSNQSNRRNLQSRSNGLSGRAKVKIGSRKGRATINSNGDVDVEEETAITNSLGVHSEAAEQDSPTESAHTSDLETAQDPEVLYCICLGHDDHTPMIQCEGCENWFHFSCIQLDPAEAQEIAAFYCQVCHASGTGVTLKVNEESAAPEAMPETTPKSIPNSPQATGEKSPADASICDKIPEELSNQQVNCSPASESVDLHPEKKSPVTSSPQVMTRSSSDSSTESGAHSDQARADSVTPHTIPPKSSRRKFKSAEGLSCEEDTSDQDFTGEDSLRVTDRKRKTPISIDSRPSTQRRISSSTPFSTTPPTPSTPVLGAEKTRRTCAEQFFKLFEPIFYNKSKQDMGDAQEVELRSRSEDMAMRFSEAVESELFESFGEPDAHNQKAPRRQYMTKLRALLFNLKNNPSFLNSLSSLDLSPRLIVCMSHEDLQTPQQKALADQIRQRSLHDSVKTLVPGLEPITPHKADETVVASPSQPAATEKKAAIDDTNLASNSSPLPIPHHQGQLSQPKSPAAIKPSELPTDLKPLYVEKSTQPTASEPHQGENLSAKDLTSNNLLGSFDLEKVFAAIRSVPASLTPSADTRATKPHSIPAEGQKEAKEGGSEDSMDLENTPEREVTGNSQAAIQAGTRRSLPDDYDPFVLTNGVDADLDAILHGDTLTASPSRSTRQLEPQTAAVSNLAPIVWTGNVMTADAGGFAACAVQVGGRSLSPDGFTLGKILPPDTMTVVGRLSVKDSTNYLVQNHFAPTRELVILDLRPNLKGPPELPSPERVIQHKQNLIEFFTKKGRHAVVAVNDKVKQTVRDIYLVPILRQEPLPEFVQLLDNVSIPESVPRDQDMMIAVLVLSKGVVPSVWKPPSNNPIEPSFNPGLALAHQAQVAPSLGSTASVADAKYLLASSHTSSLAPSMTPYPVLPVQSMSTSAPIDPIPLLQSFGTQISAGSNPLPFSLLSQLTPSISTTAPPGAPPGFVPYVAPQANLPPVSSSNPSISALDLSKVDVSALQALLLNQQALQPILNQPPPQALAHTQPQPHSQALPQPPNLPLPPSSTQRNGRSFNNASNGPRNSNPPSTLPTPPRPANLPLNPNFAHHHPYQSMSPPNQHQPWSTPDQQHRPGVIESYPSNSQDNNRQQTKALMRMGEVIRSSPNNEETHRRRGQHSGSPAAGHHRGGGGGGGGGGRSKRHSYEFVAPPRDGGWAGRGRGKKT